MRSIVRVQFRKHIVQHVEPTGEPVTKMSSSKQLLFPTLLLISLTGCTAVSTSEGDSTVYSNSVPFVLGLTLIGLAFLVFGVGIAKESLQSRQTRSKRKSRSRKRSSAKKSSRKRRAIPWGVLVGGGLTLIGAIIMLMGVPSSLMAFVKVGPEQVVIRDDLFWFATSPKTFAYSSVSSIDHEVVKVLARRGVRNKEYLYITHAGGHERIEMTPIHKAAREHLERAFQEYRNSPTELTPETSLSDAFPDSEFPIEDALDIVSSGTNDAPIATPVNQTSDSPSPQAAMTTSPIDEQANGLTPIDHIGRFRAGRSLTVKHPSGRWYAGSALEVYAENKMKIRYNYGPDEGAVRIVDLSDANPAATLILAKKGEGPGREIKRAEELAPGTKVLAHYDGDWLPAEVKGTRNGKPIIQWDGESRRTAVPLSRVRMKTNE